MTNVIVKETIFQAFENFIGKTSKELCSFFNVDSKSKSLLEILVSRILGIKGKANNSTELIRSNIVLKTIRVQENSNVKESMSFPTFDFKKIIETSWKESDIRNLFLKQTFLFVVFKEEKIDYRLVGIKFWQMPLDVLDNDVRKVWEKTVSVIKSGDIVAGIKHLKTGKGIVISNFPGMSFNKVCHVRPHAQNSNDTYELPVPDKLTGMTNFTKQCFWLNSLYIKEIINND